MSIEEAVEVCARVSFYEMVRVLGTLYVGTMYGLKFEIVLGIRWLGDKYMMWRELPKCLGT